MIMFHVNLPGCSIPEKIYPIPNPSLRKPGGNFDGFYIARFQLRPLAHVRGRVSVSGWKVFLLEDIQRVIVDDGRRF